jgi:hypothetical protein
LAGDEGYGADWIEEYLIGLEIKPVIPSTENEERSARPVEFDKDLYRRKSIVECLIGWLKEAGGSSRDSRRRPRISVA